MYSIQCTVYNVQYALSLQSKEYELVQMRTSEASLTSQVQGLSQQLEEMRTSLSLKNREFATCVNANERIVAELKQGEEGVV